MKDRKLRILWKSNAPHVGSGYGVQANSLLPRLVEHPDVDEVAIFGYFGIMGGLCELPVGRGIPRVKPKMMQHYPLGADVWGNDIVWEHAKHFGADVVITLMDVWVLRDDYGHGGFLWVPYAPVDHDPIPPLVLSKLRQAFHPVAYSKHASRLFDEAGLDHHYIPHGVETDLYRPLSRGQKHRAKRWLGFSAREFVVGCVAANKGWPSRKGFPELMEAFALFAQRRPEARLMLHTSSRDIIHGGPDLLSLARLYGIADKTRLTAAYINNIGFSTLEMRTLYNAFDVFCLPSMGEGFGIPLLEAQSCGVPVITTDFTACSELCGAGWLVPPAKKFPTPLDSFQVFASVPHLVDALEEAYQVWKDADRRQEYEHRARAFAMSYDWQTLVEEQWNPFVSWLARAALPRTIQMPAIEQVEQQAVIAGG